MCLRPRNAGVLQLRKGKCGGMAIFAPTLIARKFVGVLSDKMNTFFKKGAIMTTRKEVYAHVHKG